MAKDQTIAINDAVHKLQLALLEGITDQKQLFAAGSLMSRLDYEDVVTERTISNLCGFPLCRKSLPSAPSRRGRYRISLKEHKVYDLQETSKFCSSDCLISSRAFSGTLQDLRCSVLNPVKLNEILRLFEDSKAVEEESVGVNEDLGLSKLRIHENVEPVIGEVSLEEWMGPSNAIEGYVPMNHCNSRTRTSHSGNGSQESKANQDKQGSEEDSILSEADFVSTVITNDECIVSKLPPRMKEAVFGGKSVEYKEKIFTKGLEQQAAEGNSIRPWKKESSSSANRDKSRSKKNSAFNEMGFMSSIITGDEYSVSKLPPHSTEVPLDGRLEEAEGHRSPKNLELQTSLSGLPSAPRKKGLSKKPRKVKFVEKSKSATQEGSQTSSQDGGEICAVESCYGSLVQDMHSSSESTLKASLKPSGSKKLNRSVTWADETAGHESCGYLCEVRNIEDTEAGPEAFSLIDKDDGGNVSRFARAEACARALSWAAEAVASGDSDVTDAVSEAGIILLPKPHQLDEEVSKEEGKEVTPESEPTLLKWPKKPGVPDSDIFDPNQSWFDEPPEGFVLTLSTFATMWNALFGWVTSSSLAYIYGKDESAHEEYLVVNGREYPRKIILGDGRSLEIKETLSGCLARALPGLTTGLGLPIPTSELEKGLASMLDTMLFTEALPALRMSQWQVIVFLFIEALSVSQIPLLAPYMSNRRMLHQKVLEGAGIGVEEYEIIMRDILMPLGRVPHFSAQSGA